MTEYDPRWHGTEVSERGVIISTDQVSAFPAELTADDREHITRRQKILHNTMYGKTAADFDTIDWPAIQLIDAWLDASCSDEYRAQPLAQDWARASKVIEELGEAIERLIKFTGQNPRKPSQDRETERAEFLTEMADVVFTAILCMQHFTQDTAAVRDILRSRLARLASRARIAQETPLACSAHIVIDCDADECQPGSLQ